MAGQTVILAGKADRSVAKSLIDMAPVNAVVKISAPRRTAEQNDKLWAMLSDISRAKPGGRYATPDVWKAVFCHACGHAVQFETGLNGQPFPMGYRTSRMTKSQMADLITFILQWGDENGVQWSNEAKQ